MNRDQAAETVGDDLGVELERLVAIEPSPELPTRVRERVAADRAAAWGPSGWQFMGIAAMATMLAIAVVGLQNEPVTAPLPVVPPSNAPAISLPIVPLDVALSPAFPPRVRRAVLNEPVAASFPVLAMPPLEPLTEISIEPVAIEPLSAIAPLAGEHQ